MVAKNNKIILTVIGVLVAAALVFVAIKTLNVLGVLLLVAFVVGILVYISVLKEPALGPLWIVATLPFERLLTLDVGGATAKPVHGVILIVLLAWITLFLMNKMRLNLPLPVWLASLFWLVGAWSYSVSVEPNRTIMVSLFWLIALLGFWLSIQYVQNEKSLKRVMFALIVVVTAIVLFGFFQIAGDVAGLPFSVTGIKPGYDKSTFGFPRVHSTLPEPLYYGNFLLVPFFCAVTYFLYNGINKVISRRWSIIISILILISICLTFSRGAYLGLLVGSLLLVIWQYKRFFRRDNIIIVLSVLGLGLVLGLSFFIASGSRARDEILSHLSVSKTDSESVVSREQANERAYEYWQKFPWRGVGLGGYGALELEDKYESYLTDYHPIVNNQYLETLVETGTLGIMLFIAFFATLFWRSYRAWQVVGENNFLRSTLAGLTLGVIAILAQYATFSTIYIIYIWFFIGLLVATQEIIFKLRRYEQ